jgi:hypothetical protein
VCAAVLSAVTILLVVLLIAGLRHAVTLAPVRFLP